MPPITLEGVNYFKIAKVLLLVLVISILILSYITFPLIRYLYTNGYYQVSEKASSIVQKEPPVFIDTFPQAVIDSLWYEYSNKIQDDGRTIDRDRDYLTTSEGQSYSLLRAVWTDDKDTFDRVLKWTNNNLKKRPNDELFAWKWGQNEEGNWDVLYGEGGINTATDADQDIALALIFAHKRWNQESYLEQAKVILNDIWRVEVIEVQGKPYLLAGNWARGEQYPTINPSYFSFAAYPIFAEVDKEHDWLGVQESSYEVLERSSQNKLDKNSSAYLPPDWVSIDPSNGEIIPSQNTDKKTHFSDDAYRTYWRVALDWKWHKNPRALKYLQSSDFLIEEWRENALLYATYDHSGNPTVEYESNSLYGSILPYFEIVDPQAAKEVLYKKIAPLYSTEVENFRGDLGYYSQNWVWFGLAGYYDRTINLFEI